MSLQKGINGLSDLVSSGNFKIMDDKALSGAMEKALDFTYQTGKYRGKKVCLIVLRLHLLMLQVHS